MEARSGLRLTSNDQAANKQVPLAASPQRIIPLATTSTTRPPHPVAEEAELLRGRDRGAEPEREQFSRLARGRVGLAAVLVFCF
jgi:hypothetical protein